MTGCAEHPGQGSRGGAISGCLHAVSSSITASANNDTKGKWPFALPRSSRVCAHKYSVETKIFAGSSYSGCVSAPTRRGIGRHRSGFSKQCPNVGGLRSTLTCEENWVMLTAAVLSSDGCCSPKVKVTLVFMISPRCPEFYSVFQSTGSRD